MKVLITEEQLKLIVSNPIKNDIITPINESNLNSVGNKIKTILNKISIKKGEKDISTLNQNDLSAAIPSSSLKKYLGQLKAIISPLYSLAIAGEQEQSAACRSYAKEVGVLGILKGSTELNSADGNFTGDKYHVKKLNTSVEAIKDLIVRMKEDMKNDFKKI